MHKISSSENEDDNIIVRRVIIDETEEETPIKRPRLELDDCAKCYNFEKNTIVAYDTIKKLQTTIWNLRQTINGFGALEKTFESQSNYIEELRAQKQNLVKRVAELEADNKNVSSLRIVISELIDDKKRLLQQLELASEKVNHSEKMISKSLNTIALEPRVTPLVEPVKKNIKLRKPDERSKVQDNILHESMTIPTFKHVTTPAVGLTKKIRQFKKNDQLRRERKFKQGIYSVEDMMKMPFIEECLRSPVSPLKELRPPIVPRLQQEPAHYTAEETWRSERRPVKVLVADPINSHKLVYKRRPQGLIKPSLQSTSETLTVPSVVAIMSCKFFVEFGQSPLISPLKTPYLAESVHDNHEDPILCEVVPTFESIIRKDESLSTAMGIPDTLIAQEVSPQHSVIEIYKAKFFQEILDSPLISWKLPKPT